MSKSTPIKAALLIVGNEILSGRTQDANVQWIANNLGARGITLTEVRVVPDDMGRIVSAVKDLKEQVDYLFTTGGIGPTHDDITAASIAQVFGVKLEHNKEAVQILENHYGKDNLNQARMKMAEIPEGASLIRNPVSGAPGFTIGNVYVMAGVPMIMQGMLENVLPTLREGAVVMSNTVTCGIPESQLAKPMGELQKKYPDVDIGSYPHFRPGISSVSIVLRSTDEELLKKATRELVDTIYKIDDTPCTLSLQVLIDD
ncbi:MAG: competence/damage-inducible protein A [Alphaproteobacteria bacterium]|nr:competence/damage-inducible protein A [Alphaproteobacteria bacterium]